MKAVSCIVLVVAAVALTGAAGCKEKSSAFPLNLATVEKTHDGRISFEEKRGEIFVYLTDRFGDCHIHLLDYHGVSKEKALEILKAKQAELEKTSAEPDGAANGSQPIRSETNETSPAAGSRR